MESFDLQNFKTINTIIERDSKDTTYKFALLRSVIEVSQEFQHLRKEAGDLVSLPLGLLIEKWLLYYYPIIESQEFLPQMHGEKEDSLQKRISFRPLFKEVTDYYAGKGGFSVFYNDYVNGSIPPEISSTVSTLIVKLKTTITTMPMKHLGRSQGHRDFSVFTYNNDAQRIPVGTPFDQESVVHYSGTFSFRNDLFWVFQYLGSFISGDDSLVYQWAEFTSKASGGSVAVASVMETLRTVPETSRAVSEARQVYMKLYQNSHALECVWSGKQINDIAKLHVDHMIPFTVWKNNNLWNLLPSLESVNGKKRDMIPSQALIDKRSDAIAMYWDSMHDVYPKRFSREINLALTGSTDSLTGWQNIALERLREKCEYLIEVRGFDAWSLP
jgi:hypothetical protein